MICRRLHLALLAALLAFAPLHARKSKEGGHDGETAVDVKTTITAVSAADLIIDDNRVEGSTSWTIKLLSPTSLEQRKANLIVEVCRRVGADVLVDPQFTYSKRFLGGGKLTVSGYPARYASFRTMTQAEVDSFIVSPAYETGKVVFINK